MAHLLSAATPTAALECHGAVCEIAQGASAGDCDCAQTINALMLERRRAPGLD
jgi:hypothetical protein